MSPLTRVTLKDVVNKAMMEKEFLNSLFKNSTAALKRSDMKLSAADKRKLDTLIRKARKVNLKPVEDLIKYAIAQGLFPPPEKGAAPGAESLYLSSLPPWPWPAEPVATTFIKLAKLINPK